MRIRTLLPLSVVFVGGCRATVATGPAGGPPPPPPPPEVRDHREPPPPPPPVHEPAPPHAPAWNSEGWTMLGTQTVDGRHDRDSIPVSAVRNKYSELTLVVVDSDLQLENMVVHFGNGTKFEPNIKHTFREGQRTRAIELPGPNDRYITSIDLQYSNIPGGGRARVEVWGRDTKKQASGPAAPPPAPVWDSKGWTQLGTATVQGKTGKLDKDTIPVGQRDGKWDEVMLVVIDSDLQMDDVTVVLGDKERFTPKLKHVFKEGQRTQAIALPHGNRFIDHIELTYSNLPGGGNARVEAWGKPAKAK